MSKAIDTLQSALQRAMTGRPQVGGFPYLAETLRRAGVERNCWYLPSCQGLYVTEEGSVVNVGTPLVTGIVDIPTFDQDALIVALRTNQAGKSTFEEFLAATWQAGVVRYEVDFSARAVSYFGASGEEYVEVYPLVVV